mmetsp:Transcript_22291/g.76441  ORF Transcript_22291/g.76441 Transcript_22291/m.76441 type:complete len:535 (-) Transcript_22291:197-1801(-)
MRGDTTPAAVKWLSLYGIAKKVLDERGPAGIPEMEGVVDEVLRFCGGARGDRDILSRVLMSRSWTSAMSIIGDECNMMINACNLASLRDGRPAPLEMPENVVKLAATESVSGAPQGAFAEFSRVWLGWLASVTPSQRGKWAKRAAKYKVSLGDAVAAMFVFDAMCFEALIYMYAGDDARPEQATVASIMHEHLKFHNWLPFTTEAGKYMKLIEVLAELQFPEVVCLQEAYDLVMMAKDEREKSQLGDRLFSTFEDKYAIHCAGETALLLRNDRFAAGDYKLDEKLDAAQGGWRSVLEARGLALHGGTKIVDDWNTTLSRTVVVKARLHKLLYRDATAPTSARKLMPARWTSQMMLSPSDRAASQVGAQTVPLVLCALHGKGGSEVMDTFVTELADVLSDVPHVDAFVIGMDSNTSNADALQATLTRRGIMSSEAVSSSQKTVSKSRTLFQTQVRKTGVLDISLKDFVVAWKVGPSTKKNEAKTELDAPRSNLLPLVSHTELFPEIQDSEANVAMLMPTAQWPFDHSMVIVAVAV